MIVDCHQCAKRHVILDRSPQTVAHCECGARFALKVSALESGALKCGNCGGNPPAGESHCPYCDAHLAQLRCARCLASSIEGDLHCRACGHVLASSVEPRAPGPDGVLACPRCDGELDAIMVGDAVLDECTRCGGVWLAHDVLGEILRNQRDHTRLTSILRELDPVPTVALGAGQSRKPPETDDRFYVNCPQCGDMMDRRQFAKVSGIVVDVCKAHGVWFDHDELPRVVQYVGDGGMQRAAEKLYQQRMASLDSSKRHTLSRTTSGYPESSLSSGVNAAALIGGIIGLLLG